MKQGITSGFFNAKNADRRYDAYEMSSLFSGIIRDGIFMDYKDGMLVAAKGTGDMTVFVYPGKCWFNGLWTEVHEVMPLTCDTGDVLYNRVDSVVLKIDTNESERENSIYIKKGTPGTNAQAPALQRDAFVYEVRLANITIPKNSRVVTPANTSCLIGTSHAPWSTGILDCIDVDHLYTVWQAWFEDWRTEEITKWTKWCSDRNIEFSDMKEGMESAFDAMSTDMERRFTEMTSGQTVEFNTLMDNIQAWWEAMQAEISSSEVMGYMERAEAAALEAEAIKNELEDYANLNDRFSTTEMKRIIVGPDRTNGRIGLKGDVNSMILAGKCRLIKYNNDNKTNIEFNWSLLRNTDYGHGVITNCSNTSLIPQMTFRINDENNSYIYFGIKGVDLEQYDVIECSVYEPHTGKKHPNWSLETTVGYSNLNGFNFTLEQGEGYNVATSNKSGIRYMLFVIPDLQVDSWMHEEVRFRYVNFGIGAYNGTISWQANNGSLLREAFHVEHPELEDDRAHSLQGMLAKNVGTNSVGICFYFVDPETRASIRVERYDYDGKPKPISFGLKSMDFATLSNAGWAFYPPNNPPVEGTNNFKKYSLTQGKILTGHTVPTSALKGQVFLKWK